MTVDVERIQSGFLQLEINTGTTSSDSNVVGTVIDSPRSTRSRQLQRRKLFSPRQTCTPQPPWSVREEYELICFLLQSSDGQSWVSRRGDVPFWNSAGDYIHTQLNSTHRRTG